MAVLLRKAWLLVPQQLSGPFIQSSRHYLARRLRAVVFPQARAIAHL